MLKIQLIILVVTISVASIYAHGKGKSCLGCPSPLTGEDLTIAEQLLKRALGQLLTGKGQKYW